MSKNTVVRGCLVPSLKNKPLDGRQDVPMLEDIAKIENPYVGFTFFVKEVGKWFEVVSLKERVINDLTIPDDMVDGYKEFGRGMTDDEKEAYLTKVLAEQHYLSKEEAAELYLSKEQADEDYLKKEEASETYQPKGNYLTKQEASETYAKKEDVAVLSAEEIAIGDAEPTGKDVKLWVDTSVVDNEENGDEGGNNEPSVQYENVNVSISAKNGASITAYITINGETKSVTSGSSVPWKVEYGTEYIVEAGSVNGLITPVSLKYTAMQETRNIELIYETILITVARFDQTITDPDGIITRTIDEGGIEAIRSNSHRYVAKKDEQGVLRLRQLDDNDGTKYLDGTTADLSTLGNDVFMKLPKFYWKISEVESDKWDFYLAYGGKPDSTYKEWDGKDLIGVYHAYSVNSKLYSSSGRTPTTAIGINSVSYASNRGEGYSLTKWKHRCMIAMLAFVWYSTTDIELYIGGRYHDPTSGLSDSYGMTDTKESESINFNNLWGLEYWTSRRYQEFICNIYSEPGSESGKIIWSITEDDGNIRTIELEESTYLDESYVDKVIFGDNLDLVRKNKNNVLDSNNLGYMTFQLVGGREQYGDRYHYIFMYITNNSTIGFKTLNSHSDAVGRLCYRGEYIIES